MALSDSVIESLKEADACLRNALAYAARQEEPYVALNISKMLVDIDSLICTDRLLDDMQDMLNDKKHEDD